MPTFMQAVERLREHGQAPTSGPACLRSLAQGLAVAPCLREVQGKALAGVSQRTPWAVILCRYKGEPRGSVAEQLAEAFYRGAFKPGSGGLVEYWRDVSLGVVDLSGSVVFDWVELEIPLSKAGIGAGTTRTTTVDYAINAVGRSNLDAVTGFSGQIAVVTHNWSVGNLSGTPDWATPKDPLRPFYANWIDGSAEGTKTTLTPPHDGSITAHEMAHGFGMQHDVAADFKTHYADPCCIMSVNNRFVLPPFGTTFGPGICLPHLVQKGWMFGRRLYVDDGSWMSEAHGISLPLAPLTDPGTRANLGLRLPFERDGNKWDYYIEYVQPIRWNQGLQKPFVFIRRFATVDGLGETPIILGTIAVPASAGTPASFLEPMGRVMFEVHWQGSDARVLKVTAIKL